MVSKKEGDRLKELVEASLKRARKRFIQSAMKANTLLVLTQTPESLEQSRKEVEEYKVMIKLLEQEYGPAIEPTNLWWERDYDED